MFEYYMIDTGGTKVRSTLTSMKVGYVDIRAHLDNGVDDFHQLAVL
jgi:hypothetical protein